MLKIAVILQIYKFCMFNVDPWFEPYKEDCFPEVIACIEDEYTPKECMDFWEP